MDLNTSLNIYGQTYVLITQDDLFQRKAKFKKNNATEAPLQPVQTFTEDPLI